MYKFRKMLRNKRGFSPVIAALILMLLAVAAGVVLYAYVMGWLGGATETSSGIKGNLQFDSIWHNTTHVIFTIRNVGQKSITPDAVYVDGAKKSLAGGGSWAALAVLGESSEFYVAHTLTAGYFAEVKVSCTDGTVAAQSVEAKS